MASRPDTRHAIQITPKEGASVILLVDSSAAANALVTTLLTDTDAKAEDLGKVYDLPMVAWAGLNATSPIEEIEASMRLNFSRTLVDRRLIELRDLIYKEDDAGGYWAGTALWVFPSPPPKVSTPGSMLNSNGEN